MKVAMFSNYLNHHQLPFCKAMVELTGGEFVFVASTPVNPARLAIGYNDMNSAYPFVVRSYESEAQYREAQKLALDCDVMILGSAPEEFIDARLRKRPDAVTFRYSERLFKESAGKVNRLSPFFWASCFGNLLRRRPNYYLLAASAYAPIDYYHIGFGKGKYLKWGYFPKSAEQSLELIAHKKASRLRIMRCI